MWPLTSRTRNPISFQSVDAKRELCLVRLCGFFWYAFTYQWCQPGVGGRRLAFLLLWPTTRARDDVINLLLIYSVDGSGLSAQSKRQSL